MRKVQMALIAVTVTFALGACGPAGVLPATLDVGSLATSVSSTMTALAPMPHSLPTTPPPAASTEVPQAATPSAAPPVRVVYVSGGDVWLVQVPSAPVRLTQTGKVEQVLISDDGQSIVYTRRENPDGPAEIRAINPDGSNDRSLLGTDQLNALHPLNGMKFNDLANLAFIPRTHRLAFNTRAVAEGPGLAKYDDLNLIDVDSGARTAILAAGNGGDFTYSPDGSRLAITRATNINLVNADGTQMQANLISFPLINTASEYMYYPKVVWSIDGSAFGVVIPSQEPFTLPTSGSVWKVGGGGEATKLATIPGDFFRTTGGYALLSPDLAHVAFTRDTGTTNVSDLLIARADGSEENKVATGTVVWQGWGPDGQTYLFTQGSPMTLMLGSLGAPPTTIGPGSHPRWIDGRHLVYLGGSAGAWTLMYTTIGEAPVALATADAEAASFDVAP